MARKRTTFGPDAMAEFTLRYRAGESLYAMAKQLGKEKSSLTRAFKRDGIRRRTFAEAAELRERMGRGRHQRSRHGLRDEGVR